MPPVLSLPFGRMERRIPDGGRPALPSRVSGATLAARFAADRFMLFH